MNIVNSKEFSYRDKNLLNHKMGDKLLVFDKIDSTSK
jgi:hypothetical protein